MRSLELRDTLWNQTVVSLKKAAVAMVLGSDQLATNGIKGQKMWKFCVMDRTLEKTQEFL